MRPGRIHAFSGRRWRSTLLILLGLLSATSAAASGFYIPGHGVRSMGRGGAAVVGVWDLNALWYNPALLAGIEGHQFLLDVNVTHQSVRFERAPRTLDNGEQVVFDAVDNASPPLPIPQIGYATELLEDRLFLGVGLFAPNGAGIRYPEAGSQRYTAIDNAESFLLTSEVALSVRVTDWLWLGAGLQNLMMRYRIVATAAGYPGVIGDPEDRDMDTLLDVDFQSYFNPSGIFGLWVDTQMGLQVGASVQLPVSIYDEEGTFRQRFPAHPLFDDATLEGDSIASGLDLPLIVRAGLRFAQPRWDIELDMVWERWSSSQEVVLSPQELIVHGIPGVGSVAVGEFLMPRNQRDTWSLRLGGDWETLENRLTLRAGFLWEQGAVPAQTVSVLLADATKYGLSLGATVVVAEGVELDVGYSHLFYESVNVSDSLIRQLNPSNPEGGIVVGNGRYEMSANLGGVGVRVGW